ncbi:MAG TPA: S8 family serine peptidase [Candidatus Limnocylindrales bacterium]
MPSPSLPASLHRLRWKLAAAVSAVAIVAAGIAALPENRATAAPALTPKQVTAVHSVTLITGDKVTVTTLADGKQTVEVRRPESATGGVRVQEVRGDLLVLPDEALPMLTAGKVDRRLFNVTDLIEMGYDDAKAAEVPLIATFEPSRARGAKSVPPKGSRVVRELASIGGAALRADKKQARGFWQGLGTDVKKVWLDGKVKVNLKESVPLVGAPEAWAAGYNGAGVKIAVLDTGIDATHPDLASQIDDKVSFVPGEDTSDINGHGTHVASTIVGTGAASNGDNKGVAPGADLIVGKVLGGPDGYGEDSWVIAGMQWAAESGADIVSMSLGSGTASDGLDPMSEAVNSLTAQHGTLFVIAAGNYGPQTVGSPGAAASALTIGATDKQDNLAYFSSTGPLLGTGGLKPDMTAPGVDITAARSQQMPTGEGMYRTISGTSMATPHVSGAAAILAQRHPEWTAQQLKDALTSSSKPLADYYSAYEVGTGRLDVAAALRNPVTSGGSLFFGNFDWPHEPSDAPVTKPLTFSNFGSTAVTLNLSLTGGGPFTLGAPSVTVPAGGSASVDVTGDPTAIASGSFTGYVVGTDAATGTAMTRTSVGILKEEERYNLTIKLKDRDGKPAPGRVVLYRENDFWPYIIDLVGEISLRLPPGVYSSEAALDVRGERPDRKGIAAMIDPETILDKDAEVVLDASKARLLDTVAPQRSETRQSRVDFLVSYADGDRFRDMVVTPVAIDDVYLLPTEKMTRGRFDLVTRWRMGEEALSLKAFGILSFETTVQPGSTLTAGEDVLKAVYAGNGAAKDYAKLDARGKTVVVKRSDAVPPTERTAAAAAAGAALLVVVNDGIGTLNEYVGESPIPVASVHRDEGAALIALARTGVLVLKAKQVPYPSYIYDLTRNYKEAVPNKPLTYKPSKSDLARIDANYYGVRGMEGGGYRYDMTFSPSFGFFEREYYPGTRTEWVTPDQVWHEGHQQPNGWTDNGYHDTFAKGTTTRLNWFAPAVRPAFTRAYAVQNGRYRDFMTINVQAFSSSGNDGVEHGGGLGWGEYPTNMKLFHGDTLIRENRFYSDIQWQAVPSGRQQFRLVLDAERPAEEFRLTTRSHTEWDFMSESNTADNFLPLTMLQLDYSLVTNLHGDVKAGSVQRFGVKAGPQYGAPGTGNVTSVTVDVSYDDGVTWSKVNVAKGADGWWATNLKLDGRAGGFVSLRASATTDAGFAIKQEIIRAYGLS